MINQIEKARIQSVVSQFRNYDKCVFDWLATVPVADDGQPIPVVMATPDRAFSAVNILLKQRGITTSDNSPKNIPLPFISVSSNSIQIDPSRFHGPVSLVLGRTADNRTGYSTSHPLPWNISYRAEFWSKNTESLNVFKLWLAASYRQGYESFIPVDLSNVWPMWGSKLVAVNNDGARFVGVAEPEEGHRVNRMAADFTLKAWITPPILEKKTVLRVITKIYAAKTAADLALATGTSVDSDSMYTLLDTQIEDHRE